MTLGASDALLLLALLAIAASLLAVAQRAFAMPTAARAVVAATAEGLQVAQRLLAHEHHVSATPAVASAQERFRRSFDR